MKKKALHPVHPGEVLLEEFLKPMGLIRTNLPYALDVAADALGDRLDKEVKEYSKAA